MYSQGNLSGRHLGRGRTWTECWEWDVCSPEKGQHSQAIFGTSVSPSWCTATDPPSCLSIFQTGERQKMKAKAKEACGSSACSLAFLEFRFRVQGRNLPSYVWNSPDCSVCSAEHTNVLSGGLVSKTQQSDSYQDGPHNLLLGAFMPLCNLCPLWIRLKRVTSKVQWQGWRMPVNSGLYKELHLPPWSLKQPFGETHT